MIDHQRQIVMPLSVAELIDADPTQVVEPTLVHLPRHHPLDDAAHRLPRNPQHQTDRRPVRHLRQKRRQLFERRRECAAARRPRHLLHPHPALPARHPPRRILQPHRCCPPRHMPPLAQRPPVIARRPTAAHPAPRPPPRRSHQHRQRTRVPQMRILDVHLLNPPTPVFRRTRILCRAGRIGQRDEIRKNPARTAGRGTSRGRRAVIRGRP